VSPGPLTPRQQRAAALVGGGWQQKAAAREIGVSERTVTRWGERADFRALVRQHRDAVLDEQPTARSTLEAALTATTRSGAPDWRTRVAAARALAGAEEPAPEEAGPVRETIIHTEALEDGDGDAG
jgi:hypothetical protein